MNGQWFATEQGLSRSAAMIAAGVDAYVIHTSALDHCHEFLTDGKLGDAVVVGLTPMVVGARARKAVARLVEQGFWVKVPGGYEIVNYLSIRPSREQYLNRREEGRAKQQRHRTIHTTPGLAAAVRQRDGNCCRYCGHHVDWKDRRSAKRGTYDHVIPRGPATLENIVVACGGCNSAKGARTPDEARMPLIPPAGRSRSEPSPDLDPDLDPSQFASGFDPAEQEEVQENNQHQVGTGSTNPARETEPAAADSGYAEPPEPEPDTDDLTARCVQTIPGLTWEVAEELITEHGAEVVRQLDAWPARNLAKIANHAAYFRSAVTGRYPPPALRPAPSDSYRLPAFTEDDERRAEEFREQREQQRAARESA